MLMRGCVDGATHATVAAIARVIAWQAPEAHFWFHRSEELCPDEVITPLAACIGVPHDTNRAEVFRFGDPSSHLIDVLLGNEELILASGPWTVCRVCAHSGSTTARWEVNLFIKPTATSTDMFFLISEVIWSPRTRLNAGTIGTILGKLFAECALECFNISLLVSRVVQVMDVP